MKIYFAAAAAAIVVAAPAHAASFNGAFIGTHVFHDGYEVKAKDTVISSDGEGNEATLSADGISANGTGVGLFAGYDVPVGSTFFAGVQANANISGASASAGVSVTSEGDTVTMGGKVKAQAAYGVSARLGAEVLEGTGVYARVGWQNTRFKLSVNNGEETDSDHDWKDAFVYGAGFETHVGSNVRLRAEYLIEDYGSADLNKGLGVNGIHVDNYKAVVGLSYGF